MGPDAVLDLGPEMGWVEKLGGHLDSPPCLEDVPDDLARLDPRGKILEHLGKLRHLKTRGAELPLHPLESPRFLRGQRGGCLREAHPVAGGLKLPFAEHGFERLIEDGPVELSLELALELALRDSVAEFVLGAVVADRADDAVKSPVPLTKREVAPVPRANDIVRLGRGRDDIFRGYPKSERCRLGAETLQPGLSDQKQEPLDQGP